MDEIKNTYLTFDIGENHFGVHVEHVVEIVEYKKEKSQSSVLPYMKGLTEHRGGIVPLIDTGLKFGYEPIEIGDQTCCIILSVNGSEKEFNVALIVDRVTEVVEVADENQQYIDTSYKPGYVKFAAQVNDNFVMFIDTDKVFNDSEVISIMQIMSEK